MNRILIVFTAAALLSGCIRAPKYQQPAMPVPAAWPDSATPAGGAGAGPAAADVKWNEFFADQKLRSIIELALKNNRDIRAAALNVEKVHAMYRIQRSEQFPTVSATASGNVYRLPSTSTFGAFGVPNAVTVQQYNVNVGAASWELDLFGRIRSLKSAALEQYLATEQAHVATQIALVGAVAGSYLTWAADRENLRLAQETLVTQQATYDLIKSTRDAGLASDLEVRQAESQVEAARVDIARYTGQVALDENALGVLAGVSIPADLAPTEPVNERALKEISAGLPSDVLLHRPDILMAEHQLKSSYANIGAARARFFPRIALTAATGVMSSDLSELFNTGSGTWSFAPQISLPIFDAGARKANLKIAETDRDIAIAEYEKAIQSAFREVSDSLVLRTRLMEQEQAQQALVKALDEAYKISDARYKAGIDSYLSVLIAQRSLYVSQQALVSTRLARLANLVNLYKVLGGGA